MAPEQVNQQLVDARTDIYAAGVVLWESLSGARLYDGESAGAVIQRVLEGDAPAPSSLRSEVPPALDALVLRALAADPAGRPSTAAELAADGHAAAALHGDMRQEHRTRTLGKLRDGRVRLLVATDVAARGIDVRDITHVINFDLPRNPEDYVHRIGRTGRAGAEGVAISFATRTDRGALIGIERLIGSQVPVHTVPGMEPTQRFDAPHRPKRTGFRNNGPARPWHADRKPASDRKPGGHGGERNFGERNHGERGDRPAARPAWKAEGNRSFKGGQSRGRP